ncbi:MAG: IS66 family transposase, partial [Candidatus Cloacimonadota bacterium]|nr:IS66 family transposase [Candidatus Cloacimonadota bacterium]
IQCERQAYLLLFENTLNCENNYSDVIEKKKKTNKKRYLDKLKKEAKIQPYSIDNMKDKIDTLHDANIVFDNFAISIDVIKINSLQNYSPTIIIGTNQILKEDKIKLAFSGHALSNFQKEKPSHGTIVSSNLKSYTIKLEPLYKDVSKIIKKINSWIKNKNLNKPQLVLNKNCSFCIFQKQCKIDALEQDSLSLLDRMTEKEISKYKKKGIFTLNQLSYLFKPRRQKRNKEIPLKFSLELQALALRENKIYIQELPSISKNRIEIYLDIEGIPDLDFYYLIGLLIIDGDNQSTYSYWANSQDEENKIWDDFVIKVNEYPDTPIYHYGSYDSKAISKLSQRYGKDASIEKRLVNVVSFIYSKIYFPTYSNSLKELGKFLGAKWTEEESSGVQSIVWRYKWETTKEKKYFDILIAYNIEDCKALYLVVKELISIANNYDRMLNIDFANQPKKYATDLSGQIHTDFEKTLKYAHAEYDINKIKIGKKSQDIVKEKKSYWHRRVILKPQKIVQVQAKRRCSKCFKKLRIVSSNREQTKIDLKFYKNGVRKTIIKYIGKLSYCYHCDIHYAPPIIKKLKRIPFGHSFISWMMYQRINLRLPYHIIIQTSEEIFNVSFSDTTIVNNMKYFYKYYNYTEKLITKNILKSKIIHADETKINIQGVNQYVWVFTDGENVLLKMTKTREADIVHKFLENYDGVLISDFYPGYDSVKCSQQKCWVHLIRDLNEDLWKEPFNKELELFISSVSNLIVPILQTIQKYGSKKVHLNKYQKEIKKFYKKNIDDIDYTFETTKKYQKRFKRHKNSLFTFMKQDGIPWNNNMAERAIRQLAVQRKISGSFSENAAPYYLRMLSISQTCRFKNKSFLKFLISKEKDIDKFKSKKVAKYSEKIKITDPMPHKHYPRK